MTITQNAQTLHVFKSQFEQHYIPNSAVADVAINKQIITLVLKSGDNKIVAIDFNTITEVDGAPPTTFAAFVAYIGLWLASSGLATEATLISVLNAIIASDQDIEILLVRDTGAGDVVVKQILNWETGSLVITYTDVNGNPYVPVGPLEYLDPSAVLNLILTESLDQGTTLGGIESDIDTITTRLALVRARESLYSGTNLAAGTYYYNKAMDNFNHLAIQCSVSGGVTVTVEATIDNVNWLDITKSGQELGTGVAGNISFVDTDFILDFEALNVNTVRIKVVTSDATNIVSVVIARQKL